MLEIIIVLGTCFISAFIWVKVMEYIHQKAIDKCIENFSLSSLTDTPSGSEEI